MDLVRPIPPKRRSLTLPVSSSSASSESRQLPDELQQEIHDAPAKQVLRPSRPVSSNDIRLSKSQLELITLLQQGDRLSKIPRKKVNANSVTNVNQILQFRHFWITEDYRSLCWESKQKLSKNLMKFSEMDRVVSGQTTDLFSKFSKILKPYEKASFSVIGKNRTLDLICEDAMQTETWKTGLQFLILFNKKREEVQYFVAMEIPSLFGQSFEEGKIETPIPQVPSKPLPQPPPTSTASPRPTAPTSKTSQVDAARKISSSTKPTPSAPSSTVSKEDAFTVAQMRMKLKTVPQNTTTTSSTTTTVTSATTSSALSKTSEEGGLFDFVVVVKLEEQTKKPFISYSYPQTSISKQSAKIIQTLPLFCFPDLEFIEKQDASSAFESKTYSFILTSLDGSRRYGYCRRVLPNMAETNGNQKVYPISYCIVSTFSCFGLFRDLLNAVEERNQVNSVSVYQFLKAVLAKPFPQPGQEVQVQTMHPKTSKPEIVKLKRSLMDRFEHLDFQTLFSIFEMEDILNIFCNILFENRVLFVCQDITLLSTITYCCIAMIYPFEWQHALIPVLPKSLLDMCCSPVPFLMGILSQYKEYVEELPTEEIVFVDLETKKLSHGQKAADCLPSNEYKNLKNRLVQLCKVFKMEVGGTSSAKKSKTSKFLSAFSSASSSITTTTTTMPPENVSQFNQMVLDAFIQFFMDILGSYTKYINAETNQLDSDKFIAQFGKKERANFWDPFKITQCYLQWKHKPTLVNPFLTQ